MATQNVRTGDAVTINGQRKVLMAYFGFQGSISTVELPEANVRPGDLEPPVGAIFRQEYHFLTEGIIDGNPLPDNGAVAIYRGPREFLVGTVEERPEDPMATLMRKAQSGGGGLQILSLSDLFGGGDEQPRMVKVVVVRNPDGDGREEITELADDDVEPLVGASLYPIGRSPAEDAERQRQAEWHRAQAGISDDDDDDAEPKMGWCPVCGNYHELQPYQTGVTEEEAAEIRAHRDAQADPDFDSVEADEAADETPARSEDYVG